MARKIIFISGIHGVGKSTLCSKISKELKIKSYSASDLIKTVSSQTFSSNKQTKNIDLNQDYLLVAVDNFIDANEFYLIDGHFCLLSEKGDIINIPISTFESLEPCGIITLQNNPEIIISQINKRDGKKMDLKRIISFQCAEIKQSKHIANTLNIPHLIENPIDGFENILQFVNLLMKEVLS